MLEVGRKITTTVEQGVGFSVALVDRRWSKFDTFMPDVMHVSNLHDLCDQIIPFGKPVARLVPKVSLNDIFVTGDFWKMPSESVRPPGFCGRRITTRWNEDQILIVDKVALDLIGNALGFTLGRIGDAYISDVCEFDGAIFDRFVGPAAEVFRGLALDEFLKMGWQTAREVDLPALQF